VQAHGASGFAGQIGSLYSCCVTRIAYRRLILVVALLCQVTTVVHTPLAHARAVGNAPHALAHCMDHAGSRSNGSEHTTPSSKNGARSGHLCSCGLCHCPCAQAPALAGTLTLSSAIPHLPVTLRYRAPEAPPFASVFFRPPI
jgi:hypothetical protein